MIVRRVIVVALSALAVASLAAQAEQTIVLKSFSYQSIPVACNGTDQLLPFDSKGDWKMAPGFARPGAGEFPSGSFYLRRVAISDSVDWWTRRGAYAVVGHSGANGDWVSPMIIGSGETAISYDADAAPLFSPGEYFDVHAACAPLIRLWPLTPHQWTAVSIWYVPKH